MSNAPTHYGWLVSPYTAKTRAYLQYSQQPFVDVEPSVWTLWRTIQPAVGRTIMPTVQLPDGTWLQDSSRILDHFGAQPGFPPLMPPGPTQRLASTLLEVFDDEWLPMAALHYRWSLPENHRFAPKPTGRQRPGSTGCGPGSTAMPRDRHSRRSSTPSR